MTRRADLTDAQWARLEPLPPRGKKAGRPPTWANRQLIDGIRWRTRCGTPWRDVPACCRHQKSVYGYDMDEGRPPTHLRDPTWVAFSIHVGDRPILNGDNDSQLRAKRAHCPSSLVKPIRNCDALRICWSVILNFDSPLSALIKPVWL
ncbi:transposase [Nocardia sp. NPDC051463]|uniref:transposase n=1 Tax=Nocardia sp. NPDC051463 TaxID=3154845 RepID=UPI0034510C94